MHALRVSFALFLSIAGSASAAAEGYPAAFVCRFETGSTSSYEGGTFRSAAPSPLTLEFRDINLKDLSAKIAVEGKSPVALKVMRALNANHYLEVTAENFLNVTTIYDFDPVTKAYPAVHSRHFGLLGQPVFAQYAGLCMPQ